MDPSVIFWSMRLQASRGFAQTGGSRCEVSLFSYTLLCGELHAKTKPTLPRLNPSVLSLLKGSFNLEIVFRDLRNEPHRTNTQVTGLFILIQGTRA